MAYKGTAGGWVSHEGSGIDMHGVRHFFYKTFVGAFAELRKATFSFVMSVRMGITRLQLEEFSLNLIFEHFSENMPRKQKFH